MNNLKLLLIFFLIYSCKSTGISNREKRLSNNIKVIYSKQTANHYKKYSREYINVKIINNNAVGVYIPSLSDYFFKAYDLRCIKQKKKNCRSNIFEFSLDFAYEDDLEEYKSSFSDKITLRTQKNKNKYTSLLEKTYKKEYNKYVKPQLKDSIKNYKIAFFYEIYDSDISKKYHQTYFIPANSYIEIILPIQDLLDSKPGLKKALVKTNTKYIYDNSMLKEKFFIHWIDYMEVKYKYIEIPLKYPKKIGKFHLVRWIKAKDTIIDLR